MASLNDVYRVRVQQLHANDQVADLYFDYQVTTGGSGAANTVVTFWKTKFLTGWQGLIPASSHIFLIQAINGMNNGDFFEDTANHVGTRTGSDLPSGVCAIARAPRSAPGDLYSHRRFMFGVTSDLGGTDGNWTSGFTTTFTAFTDLLEDSITLGTGDVLAPVQLTGGFILGTSPVVKRPLTVLWENSSLPAMLESRQGVYTWG